MSASVEAAAPGGAARQPGLRGWLDRHDPTRYAVHRGIRAALAVTIALPLSMLLGGGPQFTLFAAFGSLALVIFVDFPGNRRVRAFSYVTLAAFGMLLIAIGTLASRTGWLAVLGMAVIGFAILFAGVLSAASAAASRALLLAFVLPVTVPAFGWEILPRVGGWALGGVVAIPLALFLWPPREHDDLRIGVSRSCRALARAISSSTADHEADQRAAQEAFDGLRGTFRASVSRPVGLSAGGRLLARVIRDLDWIFVELRSASAAGLRAPDWPGVAPAVLTASDAVLTAAADALDRPQPAQREQLRARLDELTSARVGALNRWLGEALGERPRELTDLHRDLATVERLHSLAYATDLAGRHIAASLAAEARSSLDKVLGRGADEVMTTTVPGSAGIARHHLSWQSVWLHNSLRGGLGMALAVLLAQVTDVSHGFWVALGAMSVLRSSALNTGATTFRALGGTVVGVIIGAIGLILLGNSPWGWVVLPFVMFLAGFAGDAISFAAGQAAFSIAVLIMFSLLSPVGWEVGLVRLENVAIGTGAALVVGLLLWPRGAGGAIRQAVADAYRHDALLLTNALDRMTVQPAPASMDREESLGAAFRLDDALRQYLADRGAKSAEIEDLIAVCVCAERVRLTSEALADLADRLLAGPQPGPAEAIPAELTTDFRRRGDRQARWLDSLARELTDEVTGVPPVPPADAVAEMLAYVHRHPDETAALKADPEGVWVAIHLDDLARHQQHVLPRVNSLVGRPDEVATAGI